MAWMAWTQPTALFFVSIGVMLAVMTVLELRTPTTLRRGWLPMATTRGDRLFISLLTAGFTHLAWLGLTDASPVGASVVALGLGIGIMRKG